MPSKELPTRNVAPVQPGQVDIMSVARLKHRLTACEQYDDRGRPCTRIIGHEEAEKRDHPARVHVHAPRGIVVSVWEAVWVPRPRSRDDGLGDLDETG